MTGVSNVAKVSPEKSGHCSDSEGGLWLVDSLTSHWSSQPAEGPFQPGSGENCSLQEHLEGFVSHNFPLSWGTCVLQSSLWDNITRILKCLQVAQSVWCWTIPSSFKGFSLSPLFWKAEYEFPIGVPLGWKSKKSVGLDLKEKQGDEWKFRLISIHVWHHI